MYACIPEIERGFFAGVYRLEERLPTFPDPPPAILLLTRASLSITP